MSIKDQIRKRALLSECEQSLIQAVNYNPTGLQQSLAEVLSPENLRRSMLKRERQRVIDELRQSLVELGDEQAVNILNSVITSLERGNR